jgi:Phasin protein
MTIQERLIEMTAGVRDQAGAYAARATQAARIGVDRAADTVLAAKTPVERLADAGLRLNKLSSQYVEQFVSQQANATQDLLADGAQRLRVLAKAHSLRDAWSDQVELFDLTRARATQSMQRTLEIVSDAGRNVSELAVETYAELLRVPVKARKSPARKTVRKSARKPARAAKRSAA